MKKIFLPTAITLIELIVATMLVTVVLFGLVSINLVLNNNNQDYGQRFLLNSQTQAVLTHILNNASLAVGTGTTDSFGNLDQGILIGQLGVGDPNSFCIHQDPNNTPGNYSDDIWFCYSWTANYNINYCTMPYNAAGLNRGAASCGSSGNLTSGPTYLGTAFSMTNPVPTFSMNGLAAGNQMVFTITIQNCLNDLAASCTSAGTSTDPVNNPEVVKTGSAFPLQQGMQNS